MPSSKNYVRDYKQEYKVRSTKKDKAENAARKRARRKLEKEGKVKKGDGKDVDHKDRNTKNNSKSNLRVQKASTNRSYSRKGAGAKKYGNGKRK